MLEESNKTVKGYARILYAAERKPVHSGLQICLKARNFERI